MNISNQNFLILAPHTDDGEFGCGGTINKLLCNNNSVTYVAFSSAEESVPPGFDKDILKREVKKATNVLGISEDNLLLYNFPVRKFPEHRQSILELMIDLDKTLNPEIIFLPSTYDTHQDHNIVSQEGFRAFKKKSILGYEMPWNNLVFTTSCFSVLSDSDLSTKILSLKEYKSQFGRLYSSEEVIRSIAISRGAQIGVKYAEAFEVIRWKI